MQNFVFKTVGVCSRRIIFDVENDILVSIKYDGGCDGNLKGLSRLLEGMKVDEVVKRLKGIECGGKRTSCPDQLAIALESLVNKGA